MMQLVATEDTFTTQPLFGQRVQFSIARRGSGYISPYCIRVQLPVLRRDPKYIKRAITFFLCWKKLRFEKQSQQQQCRLLPREIVHIICRQITNEFTYVHPNVTDDSIECVDHQVSNSPEAHHSIDTKRKIATLLKKRGKPRNTNGNKQARQRWKFNRRRYNHRRN